jgi:hypothetical protein
MRKQYFFVATSLVPLPCCCFLVATPCCHSLLPLPSCCSLFSHYLLFIDIVFIIYCICYILYCYLLYLLFIVFIIYCIYYLLYLLFIVFITYIWCVVPVQKPNNTHFLLSVLAHEIATTAVSQPRKQVFLPSGTSLLPSFPPFFP